MNYIYPVMIALALSVAAYKAWYDSTDHWLKDDGITCLRDDSPIVGVEQQTIHFAGRSTIRTTVRFEDGFRYVSHKCNKRDFKVFVHPTMTDELREEILNDAKEAHKTEIALRDGTLEK